ncbi:hypothetical protein crov422 [Cafeteria roenbergensis virus]|uniref:Uncharacterized protein n=1 Tax=Cafeteria roenbergensis virus (strain BV-PW1) TaxID=693272 RepID=E3T5J3_CROVB|nr:hypothetical protein crov422 [Cafeteria roenbergensis virus BV-PW1]ADO67456.1 hypothetical protein crov422 [Cafeteria roenbergensis virus BV-PW1]
MASAFCEKSISWEGNSRGKDGYFHEQKSGVSYKAKYGMYDCDSDEEFEYDAVVDRVTVTQNKDDTLNVSLWTNVYPRDLNPTAGTNYMGKSSPILAASHVSFDFRVEEDDVVDGALVDTSASKWDVFSSHIDHIITCMGMESVIDSLIKKVRSKIDTLNVVNSHKSTKGRKRKTKKEKKTHVIDDDLRDEILTTLMTFYTSFKNCTICTSKRLSSEAGKMLVNAIYHTKFGRYAS